MFPTLWTGDLTSVLHCCDYAFEELIRASFLVPSPDDHQIMFGIDPDGVAAVA